MPIRSTKTQLEAFKESLIWKDIVDELMNQDKLAQLEYDLVGESHIDDEGHKVIPNESETLIHLGHIKGRRRAVQYFLSIPDILMQEIEIRKAKRTREVSNE